MNKKILTLLASMSLAFFMSACGDDNSSSAGVDCLDNENCLDDDISSDSDDAKRKSTYLHLLLKPHFHTSNSTYPSSTLNYIV